MKRTTFEITVKRISRHGRYTWDVLVNGMAHECGFDSKDAALQARQDILNERALEASLQRSAKAKVVRVFLEDKQ